MTALAGIRVLDCTQVLAGPYCTQLLGDLGADVVKVEPLSGDQSRSALGFSEEGKDTANFVAINRNKRSIALDLKAEAGREVFYRMARAADVVVDNYRPGAAKRLRIDYDTLRGLNPRIVCASISGFGATGPWRDRPAHDLIAQGVTGLMSVTGASHSSPAKVGISIADISAALYAALGILAALHERDSSGEGQYVTTSIFEAPLSMAVFESTQLWHEGEIPGPLGSTNRTTAPNQAFATGDGHINICVPNARLWAKFCSAIGRDDLCGDPRFATNADRMKNRPALEREIESVLRSDTTASWDERLSEAGIPVGPILDYAEVFAHPQTLATDMVQHVSHPQYGETPALGPAVKLSRTAASIRRVAPLLGQHTRDVLAETGYCDAEIDRLVAEGTVRQCKSSMARGGS